MPVLKRMVCNECGSDEVNKGASAYWAFANQTWQLSMELSADDYCEACCGETRIVEAPVADSSATDVAPNGDEAQPITRNMDIRTLSTVLAALRYWQSQSSETSRRHDDIATCGGEVEALDDAEIDSLCEEING